jgi:hypothetical protein
VNISRIFKFNPKRGKVNPGRGGFSVLKGWPVWLGIVIWFAVATVAVLSIQLVHWTTPQPNYVVVLCISVILSLVIVMMNRPGWFTLLIGLAAGLIVIIWQSTMLFTAPTDYTWLQSLGYAFDEWSRAIVRGTPSENSIYFSLFLIVIIWAWGYVGTWRLLKKNSVWRALFFGLIIVLVNLLFLNKNYYGYFYLYLSLSMIMVGYYNFVNHNFHHAVFIKLSPRVLTWIAGVILGFSALLLFFTWLTPEIKADQLRNYLEVKIQNANLIEKLDINIFNSVSSKDTVVRSTDQNDLRFVNHPDLSEDIQFLIKSSAVPNYWRVRRYDVYNPWGWSNSTVLETVVEAGQSQPPTLSAAEKYTLDFTVINKVKTDIVISSGKHLSTDKPTIVYQYDAPELTQVTEPDDNLVSVSTPHINQVDDSYSVVSEINKPTVDQLRSAQDSYPLGIVQRYVQLPNQFPFSIARLSSTIAREKSNKYDKTIAIIDYLAKYKYVQEGTFPPENKDGVSDFLFVRGSGNCTNFASAAVVMFRSIGIPARFCTGYIPHYVDQSSKTFVVLAKDYHAWAEVYFSGFGWVEFEVTPSLDVVSIAQSRQENSVSGLSNANINDFPFYYFGYQNSAPASPGGIQPAKPAISAQSQPVVLILLMIVLAAALIVLILVFRRRVKRRDSISSIMARMHLFSSFIGVPFHNYRTAQEYAEYLAIKIPRQRSEIDKLTSFYLASRYSRNQLVAREDERLLFRYWNSIFWAILKRFIVHQ